MEDKFGKTEKKALCDDEIIELFWNRDEQALEETDYKYRKLLYSLAYNILGNSQDCEECLNDAYLGAWNAIPPSKPESLKSFLATILRRRAINRYNSNKRKGVVPSEMTVSLSEIEDFISDKTSVEGEISAEQMGQIISGFVGALSERKRFIFMSRYYASEPIDAIAGDLGVSRSTVNKELAAIRAGLKEKLESEGYYL